MDGRKPYRPPAPLDGLTALGFPLLSRWITQLRKLPGVVPDGVAWRTAAGDAVSATDAPPLTGAPEGGRATARGRACRGAAVAACASRTSHRLTRGRVGTISRSPGTIMDGSGTCRRFARQRAGHFAAVPYSCRLIALSESPR